MTDWASIPVAERIEMAARACPRPAWATPEMLAQAEAITRRAAEAAFARKAAEAEKGK